VLEISDKIDVAKSTDAPRGRSSRAFYAACAGIFVVALIIRIVHVYQIRAIPLFDHLIGDAATYDRWGQQIASGEWLGRDVFYQAPLYPYFLGVVYKVLGHNLLTLRVVQCVIGAASCVLLALAGREFLSAKVGVLAGALLALYPSSIFFDSIVQKSVLDEVLICTLLYLTGRSLNRTSAGQWLGIGVTLGALMLTRENAAVLVVVILGWTCLHPSLPRPLMRLKAMGLLLAALVAVVLPVSLRNAIVGGEFHITTSQLGPNLYIGNNPKADGAYVPLVYGHGWPEQERADATALAEQAVGRALSPGEVSQYWFGKVLSFIREQPLSWLELMRVKLLLFWNATELGDTEDQYVYADWSAVLRLLNPVLHFGVLCAGAAVGFVLTLRSWRRLWVLYAIIVCYAASVIAFYVMARYRFPIVPPLMLFAASGTLELWDWLRGGRRIEMWLLLVCLVLCGWVLYVTHGIRSDMVRASTYQNIAHVLDEQHKLDEAFHYYSRAREIWPNDALLNIMLGRIRLDQGDASASLPFFAEAVRISPDYAPAHVAYGAGLLVAGQTTAAAERFQRALALDPANERAQEGMRQVRARGGGEFRLAP
jgi:4-amino-4-deoxy-L-arabinose transferase-like glycosyltransferase